MPGTAGCPPRTAGAVAGWGACSAIRGWRWRPVSMTGPGGNWTPGIRGATRGSPFARVSPAGRSAARPGRPGSVGEERDQVAPQRPAGVGGPDLVHPDRPAQPVAAPLRALAGIPARPGRRGRRPAAGRCLRRGLPALGLRSRAPFLGRPGASGGLGQESQPRPAVGSRPDGLPGRPPSGSRPDSRPVALGRADRRASRHLAASARPPAALRAAR